MILAFGLRTAPLDKPAVWGARLIWPDDLVWDRQSIDGSDEGKAALHGWLNSGALKLALEEARRLANAGEISPREDREITLLETNRGVVKANPQSSHGYLYIAAWLKD